MQAITEDPKDKSSKSAGKEKFTRFFDLLDEVVERHKFAQVLEDDPASRAEIGEEIVMLVVPSFQRFTQKQRDKEFSKSESLWFFLLGTALNSDCIMLYCRSAEVYV
jgi:exocyst complex protein 7